MTDPYEIAVVPKRTMPTTSGTNLEKGHWLAVVRRIALLEPQEALRITVGDRSWSVRSSLHCAATHLGLVLTMQLRGDAIYCWVSGKREPARFRAPRQPIRCDICGKLIHRPVTGGSRQYRCPGVGTRKSPCQAVAGLVRSRGYSIEEAKARSARWKEI